MKIAIRMVCVALFAFIVADRAMANPAGMVDLYIFSGQSNMRGHVSISNTDAIGPQLIPSPYKEALAAPVDWAQQWNANSARPAATDQAKSNFGNTFVPFRAGIDPSGRHPATGWGPEVAFLFHRHEQVAGTIWFVKYAVGGTSLAAKPTTPNWNVSATGTLSLLDALVSRVNPAVDWLLAHGAEGVRLHLLWAQGESDGGALGTGYARNFDDFRGALASRLVRPAVTFEVATMTLVQNPGSRQAQAQILIGATRATAQVVNVHDYSQTLFIADKLHLGPEGQIRHGLEMEALERTRPRLTVDHTAVETKALRFRIPVKPLVVGYLEAVADGATGLEWAGDTEGLALDPLYGRISVTDPALVAPGVRRMVVSRHTAAGTELTSLAVTFYR